MKNKLDLVLDKWTNQSFFSDTKNEDIIWMTQENSQNAILLYEISNDVMAIDKFFERVNQSVFRAIFVNKPISKKIEIPVYVIEASRWREFQKDVCDIIFPLPRNLKIVGITGTNGKTTTTDLLWQMLKLAGKKVFSIGTLGIKKLDGSIVHTGLTTPGFLDLRKTISFNLSDDSYLVMEVSSHALDQERVFGLKLDVAAWTSFSQDHLDYHGSMEEYARAKCKIWKYLASDATVFIPENHQHVRLYLSENQLLQTTWVSQINDSSLLPEFLKVDYNQENLALALSLLNFLGAKFQDFQKLIPVPGRLNFIELKNNSFAVIDFAHTPDALEKLLQSLKVSYPDHFIHLLFGCGGNRYKSKRPVMGKVAENFADKIYITSDNPRFESPEDIILDIKAGIKNQSNVIVISDRKQSVYKALLDTKSQTILVLAGKGNENYIEIKGVKYPYSDSEQVEKYLKEIHD